jgi:hypothetical protein
MSMSHTDPVCGMQVDERTAGAKSTTALVHFCMKAQEVRLTGEVLQPGASAPLKTPRICG